MDKKSVSCAKTFESATIPMKGQVALVLSCHPDGEGQFLNENGSAYISPDKVRAIRAILAIK